MNVVPQDSTNPQRPNVEGLRSFSDQNGIFPGSLNSISNTGRDLTRTYNYTAEPGRSSSTSNLEPISNPYNVPQIPISQYRRSGSTQYTIPQRMQSLGYGSDQASIDAHRRAMTMMLRQQAGREEDTNALRRRMSAVANTPNTANLPPRYSATPPMIPNFSRPSSSIPNMYPASTMGYPPNSQVFDGNRSRNGYNLPRWQPDAEVTNCPICGHTFTWLYRKHHCRKCGRVVCANCSPHKITIPRQYIVNPPSVHPVEVDLTRNSAQDNTAPRLAADQLQLSMDGGQEVRLCNPCVPDPNPLPPSQIYSRSSNALPVPESAHVSRTLPEGYVPSRRRSHHMSSISDNYARYQNNPLTRHRLTPQSQYSPLNSNPAAPYGSAPNSSATHLSRYSQSRAHRHHASLSMLPSSQQRRSMFESMTTPEAPFEDSPQRQIAEEDECPICHEELPPKGSDGSETERESHITLCIETHFSSSRPKDDSSNAVASELSTTPGQTGSSLPNSTLPGPSSRRRTTGMVVYNATEKDCIGEDGTPQECIICFEDFEAGTEMGRLECLCKFHKACIRSWWDTKGVGACPVHQGGLI